MANLTQTAAEVGVRGSTCKLLVVQAGEAVTQGMPLYRLATDGKYYKAESGDTEAKALAIGVAMTPAAADEHACICTGGGNVDLGATLTAGEVYAVSATAGSVCPTSDLVSTDYVTILGVAASTAAIALDINATAIQV